jgi:hypothetical protein
MCDCFCSFDDNISRDSLVVLYYKRYLYIEEIFLPIASSLSLPTVYGHLLKEIFPNT